MKQSSIKQLIKYNETLGALLQKTECLGYQVAGYTCGLCKPGKGETQQIKGVRESA